MKRFLENYSAGLSFLTVVICLVAVWWTVEMRGRATWSGEPAPPTWIEKAKAEDVFAITGHDVAYWGKPDAAYSKYATRKRRKPVAVVVHHTGARPVKSLVTYGHYSDPSRGGGAFGYHFYVGRDGHIVQGAPLTRRTNHIKFRTNKKRRDAAKHLWSGNTIGVSLVGGCDPMMRPDWRARGRCVSEFITDKQLRAGLAVVRALQDKFGMACGAVWGHGDLQFDRQSFEGVRLSRLSRRVCELEDRLVAPKPVAVTPAKSAAAAAKSNRANGG